MAQGLIIRKAKEQDIAELARMEILCFTTPWSEPELRKDILNNPLSMYLVALKPDDQIQDDQIQDDQIQEDQISDHPMEGKPDRIIGYAGVWMIMDEGHITNVAVHPDYRRQGIAEALVAEMISLLEQQGIADQTLEVRSSNQAALALYQKTGFCLAGIRKEYYQDNNEDALIMWRRS